jgi:hypothetical protein
MKHMNDYEKSLENQHVFWQLLNNPWPNIQELQKLFNRVEVKEKHSLLRYYFRNFITTSGRTFEVDHTLPAMEKLNKLINFSEIINETPGLAYSCLKHCHELKHMKWAVEVLKINPICFSEDGNIVYTGRGGHFFTGKYTSINLFREDGKDKYFKQCSTTTDPKEVTTLKEELVYEFSNFKKVKNYLLELGGAEELRNKKLSVSQQLEIIYKNITCCAFSTFVVVWLFSLPFSKGGLLNTLIILGISLSINFSIGLIQLIMLSKKINSLKHFFTLA